MISQTGGTVDAARQLFLQNLGMLASERIQHCGLALALTLLLMCTTSSRRVPSLHSGPLWSPPFLIFMVWRVREDRVVEEAKNPRKRGGKRAELCLSV